MGRRRCRTKRQARTRRGRLFRIPAIAWPRVGAVRRPRLGTVGWPRVRAASLGALAAAVLGLGFVLLSPAARVHEPRVPVLDSEGKSTGQAEEAVPLDGLDFVTILVVGMDYSRHVDIDPAEGPRFSDIPLAALRGRADTLMVVGLDRRTHTARVLHVHRDTIVNLGSRGPDKIAHYMAYYSFFELKKVVEDLLQMPVHRYVVVDFDGFKTLVDAIGGVTVIEPRGIGARMDLQHQFLVALGRELRAGGATKALTAYLQSPEVLKTDLSLGALIGLVREWQDVDPATIAQLTLPGVPESHYWRLDPAEMPKVLEEFWPDEASRGQGSPYPARTGLSPVFSRALAGLAGLGGDSPWHVIYFPFLHAGAGRPAPPVLVYHSHTSESFMPEIIPDPVERAAHDPNREAFSADPDLTVVRIGDEVAGALRELGLQTIHRKEVHDPGGWAGRTGAYARSRETALDALRALDGPVVILDVHRDATTVRTTVGDRPAAGILLVVARQNPWWHWNYTFARNLETRLAAVAPGLSRGIKILDGRYNEDLSPLALVVEIGGADSTMEECLVSARAFAGVLAEYLQGP